MYSFGAVQTPIQYNNYHDIESLLDELSSARLPQQISRDIPFHEVFHSNWYQVKISVSSSYVIGVIF